MYAYDTLSEAVNDMRKRGYKEDFNLEPNCISCAQLDLQLHPEHFTVEEFYRFEGISNPDDNSIVYGITSKDGVMGILVDGYGIYSESLTDDMISKLRMHPE
ncbi:phosphoribosylpyrophosphate synthetase [Polluticoccus soli]|uniref:phosphoribosylpyrophosphate synthetase n=1 Tax=Polluticoccus soli TaxID=3034150 RepID=UPI0023E1B452|nr:phosphoribosylpyrophosphate synthetase [Flavipsychrobacter sp. JY13-12]